VRRRRRRKCQVSPVLSQVWTAIYAFALHLTTPAFLVQSQANEKNVLDALAGTVKYPMSERGPSTKMAFAERVPSLNGTRLCSTQTGRRENPSADRDNSLIGGSIIGCSIVILHRARTSTPRSYRSQSDIDPKVWT
jgi:hypothetical protein